MVIYLEPPLPRAQTLKQELPLVICDGTQHFLATSKLDENVRQAPRFARVLATSGIAIAIAIVIAIRASRVTDDVGSLAVMHSVPVPVAITIRREYRYCSCDARSLNNANVKLSCLPVLHSHQNWQLALCDPIQTNGTPDHTQGIIPGRKGREDEFPVLPSDSCCTISSENHVRKAGPVRGSCIMDFALDNTDAFSLADWHTEWNGIG